MTDRYENIRKALAMLGPGNSTQEQIAALDDLDHACDPDTLRKLLKERDVLREALEMMVEMVEMNGFGRDYAMDVARAALEQEAGRG